jgi:Arc/MetJ-type ribon-helix-helix transcriptional regulator
MTRTTVTLPDELAALLAREARRHQTSVSEVVRRALTAFLDVAADGRRQLPIAALGRSGRRHTARDAEKILTAEWGHARRR